jgi:hypothetical protein
LSANLVRLFSSCGAMKSVVDAEMKSAAQAGR